MKKSKKLIPIFATMLLMLSFPLTAFGDTQKSSSTKPTDEILEDITKDFSLVNCNSSDWEDAFVCKFHNNSGYDLSFEVTLTTYDEDGEWLSSSWKEQSYFKNDTDEVMIFDCLDDFYYYDVEYSVIKTPDSVVDLYNNVTFSTSESADGSVSYHVSNNVQDGFNLTALIVYYNADGNIIDYDTAEWGIGEGNIEDVFDLPVDESLNTVTYDHYETFYQLEQ
jgi:hypothetical protein